MMLRVVKAGAHARLNNANKGALLLSLINNEGSGHRTATHSWRAPVVEKQTNEGLVGIPGRGGLPPAS